MTFPEDQIKGEYRPEYHSPSRVLVVSVTMIASALGLLAVVAQVKNYSSQEWKGRGPAILFSATQIHSIPISKSAPAIYQRTHCPLLAQSGHCWLEKAKANTI